MAVKEKIRVRLKSYDHQLIDAAAEKIVEKATENNNTDFILNINSIIKEILNAQAKDDLIRISAQTHAIGFYEKHGFKSQGEIYLDEGIEHIDMYLKKEDYQV